MLDVRPFLLCAAFLSSLLPAVADLAVLRQLRHTPFTVCCLLLLTHRHHENECRHVILGHFCTPREPTSVLQEFSWTHGPQGGPGLLGITLHCRSICFGWPCLRSQRVPVRLVHLSCAESATQKSDQLRVEHSRLRMHLNQVLDAGQDVYQCRPVGSFTFPWTALFTALRIVAHVIDSVGQGAVMQGHTFRLAVCGETAHMHRRIQAGLGDQRSE